MIRALLVWCVGLLVWAGAWCLAFHHLSSIELQLIGIAYGIPAGLVLVAWYDEYGRGGLW